jgi:tRNA1Val (adenine37-N6)-methyltransferase
MRTNAGEKIEDLQNGYVILQHPQFFSFGTDAVLLSDFTDVRSGERVVDFGTGCGIIPILLCAKAADIDVTGIEVQEALSSMAQRSIAGNALESRARIVCGDIKNAHTLIPYGVDVVVCNPPYEKADSGKENANPSVNIAKREVLCTLEDIIAAAARILRTGGRLYMIYRTERLPELMVRMSAHKIVPKRMRLVAPKPGRAPNFVLVEGRKGAGDGAVFLPTLVVCEEDGTYTPELKKIYHID